MKYYSFKCIRTILIAFVVVLSGVVATIYFNSLKSQELLQTTPMNMTTSVDGVTPMSDEEQNAMNALSVSTAYLSTDDVPTYYCMRDELAMFTQNQSIMGLCWNFSSNTVLETLLARQYGEYYDFSDAYYAIAAREFYSSIIGSGGNISIWSHLYLTYNCGVVLEADFPYENVFNVGEDNYSTIFSTIQDDCFSLPLTLEYVAFSNYNNSSYSSVKDTIIQSIKEHLMTESAIYCSVYANEIEYGDYTVYYNSTDETSNHAVTIIGWDDEFTYTEDDDTTHTGAWIVLNSYGNTWGNHGVFYMPYDEASLETIYGMRFTGTADADVVITDSNSTFTNNYVGQFAYSSGVDTTPSTVLQKNLFYSNQDIELTYECSSTYSDYDINAYFVDKNNESYSNFTLYVDENNHTIVVNSRDSSTNAGTYVLRIDFDFDNDSIVDDSVYKEIFVFSGLEIGSITIVQLSQSGTSLSTNYNERYYYDFNSYNNNTTEFELATDDSGFYIVIELASYSLIDSCVSSGSGVTLYSQNTGLTRESDNSFTNGKISVFCYGQTNITALITLSSSTQNLSITYTFNLTITDDTTYNAYVFYDLDGGFLSCDTMTSSTFIYATTDSIIYLDTPKKLNYDFAGYYSDSDYSNKLSQDDNGYYLTPSDGIFFTSGIANYADALLTEYGGSIYRFTSVVYAKWVATDITLSYETLEEDVQYGDNASISAPDLVNGSGNYDIYLSYSPSIFTISDWTIQGTMTEIQTYNLTLNIHDIDKYYYRAVQITVNVVKREIEINIDDKNSDYQQPIVELSGSISSGSMYGDDVLDIKYSTTATSSSNAGTYDIVGECSSQLYNVTFINGTYTINKIALPDSYYTIQNYEDVYDGQEHSAEFVYNSDDSYTIEYSLDQKTYTSSTPYFTDASENTFYIRLSNFTNYLDIILTANVKITPLEINVIWSNTELVYNSELLFPTFELENPLGEEISVVQSGQSIVPCDNLTASISLSDEEINYTLLNASCSYSIINADFEVICNGYSNTYDNAYHTVDFLVVSTPSVDYSISYSTDGEQFTSGNCMFKDVQDTCVYIKISADYFNDYTFETNVTVNKFIIDIIWGQTTFEYDTTHEQTPTYTYTNPLNEELDIIESITIQSETNRTINLVLQGQSDVNYELNNASCDFVYTISNAETPIPTITQNQVNSATILNDIELPENYRWADPTQTVNCGKYQYEIIYTNSDGTETTLFITLNKPEINSSWLYVIIAGFCILLAIMMLVLVIRNKNKASALALNKQSPKSQDTNNLDTYINQSKLSKSDNVSKLADNLQQSATQNNATQGNSLNTQTANGNEINNVSSSNKANKASSPKFPNKTVGTNNVNSVSNLNKANGANDTSISQNSSGTNVTNNIGTSHLPKSNATPTSNKSTSGPKLPPKPPKMP